MLKNTTIAACLLLVTGFGPSFAAVKAAPVQAAAAQGEGKAGELKSILVKLVRQDEYLDEAIEMLDTSSSRPGAGDLSALGVSLKAIAKNLRHISALNKAEFASMQSDPALANYTNTILSYSRKVDRKAGQVGALVAQLAASGKKAAMRDAVSSKKGKKARGARQLTDILEEQKAAERLASDVKTLRGASRDLAASSKWLHIASR